MTQRPLNLWQRFRFRPSIRTQTAEPKQALEVITKVKKNKPRLLPTQKSLAGQTADVTYVTPDGYTEYAMTGKSNSKVVDMYKGNRLELIKYNANKSFHTFPAVSITLSNNYQKMQRQFIQMDGLTLYPPRSTRFCDTPQTYNRLLATDSYSSSCIIWIYS